VPLATEVQGTGGTAQGGASVEMVGVAQGIYCRIWWRTTPITTRKMVY
jgi:hypothetical protein